MASSSQVATCNGGDASSTVSEDEIAMWIRLLRVQMDIKAEGVAQTQAIEDRRLKAATTFKASAATREVFLKGITSVKVRCARWSMDDFASFKSVDFEISEFLKRLEADPKFSGPQMCLLLSDLLVFDKQRNWESSFLELFWRHSDGISDDDLLLFLSKLAEHYSPSHVQEVNNLEKFMLTNEERAKFLSDCSTLDKATCLANDFNEFSLRQTQGQKPKYWTQRDHTLHSMSSESMKPLELIFPFSTRFETAKECLDRLDLLKSVTADLNPDESDTLASALSSFKSPELQALHALKKEMELHGEVALQLEQLSGKHLHAYKELSKDQLERPDEFFRTFQEEKRNVVQEALYKKVKCLASIKKVSINRQVKLSSEDLMKRIIQKAESALKEVEGKLKKTQNVDNKACTLCYSKFSKKRKRACLDPCGHASACIDCATKAWTKKPCCPWCKTSIQKPISIPAQIFL